MDKGPEVKDMLGWEVRPGHRVEFWEQAAEVGVREPMGQALTECGFMGGPGRTCSSRRSLAGLGLGKLAPASSRCL